MMSRRQIFISGLLAALLCASVLGSEVAPEQALEEAMIMEEKRAKSQVLVWKGDSENQPGAWAKPQKTPANTGIKDSTKKDKGKKKRPFSSSSSNSGSGFINPYIDGMLDNGRTKDSSSRVEFIKPARKPARRCVSDSKPSSSTSSSSSSGPCYNTKPRKQPCSTSSSSKLISKPKPRLTPKPKLESTAMTTFRAGWKPVKKPRAEHSQSFQRQRRHLFLGSENDVDVQVRRLNNQASEFISDDDKNPQCCKPRRPTPYVIVSETSSSSGICPNYSSSSSSRRCVSSSSSESSCPPPPPPSPPSCHITSSSSSSACSSSSAPNPFLDCTKDQAIATVYDKNEKLGKFWAMNSMSLIEQHKLLHLEATYKVLDPVPGGKCKWFTGPIFDYFDQPGTFTSVSEKFTFNPGNGSLTVTVLEVGKVYGEIVARRVKRKYISMRGCNYKLWTVIGTNLKCIKKTAANAAKKNNVPILKSAAPSTLQPEAEPIPNNQIKGIPHE